MAITTVRQRAALAPRREPYWTALDRGQHLGYRRTADGGGWIARHYDPATQKRTYQALDVPPHPPADQYGHAMRLAREWFQHLDAGGEADTITVREAAKRYVADLRKRKGEDPADDAEARFKRILDGDPLASIEVRKLADRHVKAWRDRLTGRKAIPVKRGANCKIKKPIKERPRSAATNNRDMSALRAALYLAKQDGYALSDLAWTRSLAPFDNASKRRDVYLSIDDRRALLDAIDDPALRAFTRGLCLLPFRPGALAALTVANYEARTGTLTVPKDKSHAGRKILLPAPAREMLNEQVKGKSPADPLFARADGSAWNKDAWKGPIRAAVTAAGINPAATAYALRHSTITDLLVDTADGGAGLDILSVAILSGTSVAMIERHYGHHRQDRTQRALAGLAL